MKRFAVALLALALSGCSPQMAEQLGLVPPSEAQHLNWPLARHGMFSATRVPNGGIAIESRQGAFVSAAADGRVSFAGGIEGWGGVVAITHGEYIVTVYADLGAVTTTSGAQLKAGDHLGEISRKGWLHFEIRRGLHALDPARFFDSSLKLAAIPSGAPERGDIVLPGTQVVGRATARPQEATAEPPRTTAPDRPRLAAQPPPPKVTAPKPAPATPRLAARPVTRATPSTSRRSPARRPREAKRTESSAAAAPRPATTPPAAPSLERFPAVSVPAAAAPKVAKAPEPPILRPAPARSRVRAGTASGTGNPKQSSVAARSEDPLRPVGRALLIGAANVAYIPAKLAYAAFGTVTGSFAYLLSQRQDTAEHVWGVTTGGDYYVTLEHLDGDRPLRFQGPPPRPR